MYQCKMDNFDFLVIAGILLLSLLFLVLSYHNYRLFKKKFHSGRVNEVQERSIKYQIFLFLAIVLPIILLLYEFG